MTPAINVFALPDRLSAKTHPTLIAADEEHFAAIDSSLQRSISDLTDQLDAERLAHAGAGQAALERDLEVHRLTARLRTLRRYGLDLCLGRMVGGETVYVGRFGLTDTEGRRLLVDWRSPAAEPFFAATHAHPMGLTSRRRYRWTNGLITDYWDEVFTDAGLVDNAALDDQSAFIASLGSSRTPRMRDVLGTIQADQDAIIRAGSHGALVVDGGPGTGKTVVALHRAAYLMYSDERVSRGGVLFIGPSPAYLSYVDDVLPSLGENSVQTCTLGELVAEGATAVPEADAAVASIKSRKEVVDAVGAFISEFERPPAGMSVTTPWGELWVGASEWAEAFSAAEPGVPHNDARDQVWDALVEILVDALSEEGADEERDEFDAYGLDRETGNDRLRAALAADPELARVFARAWPLLDAPAVVARLFSSPADLARSAPGLTPAEVAALQRDDPRAWSTHDLPLLDAARLRLGDPTASRLRERQRAATAEERARMADVIDDLIASDDSDMRTMSMLRGQDLRATLVDEAAVPTADPDLLAGPFGHIVVDEAQELTDAEWQMLLARCPSRSFTIVGDRAQARRGFVESWQDRLHRIGLDHVSIASLTVNYRTPEEVMAEAEPVIRAAVPDANVPTSVRSTGIPVLHGRVDELERIVSDWAEMHPEGIATVIGDAEFAGSARVRTLTPELAKGLEFDLVIIVRPEQFGAVDRYVAMTRATQQLVLLT